MGRKYRNLIVVLIFLFSSALNGQEYKSLLSQLDTSRMEVPVSAFKSSRLVLGQSTVQLSKGELQFRVSHLFGRISEGIDELYGLDVMQNVDISFEYGITDKLQIGLARSNDFDKTLQGSSKYSFVKQSNLTNRPVSISYFGALYVKTRNYNEKLSFMDRTEFVNQLLISRQFSEKFSAQIAPSYVYLTKPATNNHPQSLFASNFGISMGLTKSTNFNIEYVYTFPTFNNDLYSMSKNALSFGFDIETGGHVFQVFITNSTRVQPGRFIQQYNNDDFFNGDVHIGFSIMRSFNL
ncbi:MAG: hypothetical protein JKX79_07210 [Labilibaculum sp.]|nr:hypothetical protein [Labilibaculum sp.]